MTTYDKLVDQFGKPSYTCADPYEKVSCEWVINAKVLDDFAEDEDDWYYEQVSIYAWKYGRIPTEECQWNIGGYNCFAQDIIETIFAKNLKPEYSEVS